MQFTYIHATGSLTTTPDSPIQGTVVLEGGARFHGSVAASTTFTRVATGAIPMTNGADIAPAEDGKVVVSGAEIGLVTMARIGSTITFAEARNDVHIVAPADEVAPIGDAAAAAPADLA